MFTVPMSFPTPIFNLFSSMHDAIYILYICIIYNIYTYRGYNYLCSGLIPGESKLLETKAGSAVDKASSLHVVLSLDPLTLY